MATKDILQLKCSRATTGEGFEPAQISYMCVCPTKSDLSVFDRVAARGAFGWTCMGKVEWKHEAGEFAIPGDEELCYLQ